jgi:hypothetical protein
MQEFVVPKSMPKILLTHVSLQNLCRFSHKTLKPLFTNNLGNQNASFKAIGAMFSRK